MRSVCAAAVVFAVTACTPVAPTADRVPLQPRDCSRQFDAEDAGFQTCEEGPRSDEE